MRAVACGAAVCALFAPNPARGFGLDAAVYCATNRWCLGGFQTSCDDVCWTHGMWCQADLSGWTVTNGNWPTTDTELLAAVADAGTTCDSVDTLSVTDSAPDINNIGNTPGSNACVLHSSYANSCDRCAAVLPRNRLCPCTDSPTNGPAGCTTQGPARIPTHSPRVQPSGSPTVAPSANGAPPSVSPSPPPSKAPSLGPSSRPSPAPSSAPTAAPQSSPPSLAPSAPPSGAPSRGPSTAPSSSPTNAPSATPTGIPSGSPTRVPSTSPTRTPSEIPTMGPSRSPSFAPTRPPTKAPSRGPSTPPSSSPTSPPSAPPTGIPSGPPTWSPSSSPTRVPSTSPTKTPSEVPTMSPSRSPSITPTRPPTKAPSRGPTNHPSSIPTRIPSSVPTRTPSGVPSSPPSSAPLSPSQNPTGAPSAAPQPPSAAPSAAPTRAPTSRPSRIPSSQPSRVPSPQPSLVPTTQPTRVPTSRPSRTPSLRPTHSPTTPPSRAPSVSPTMSPQGSPTSAPSRPPSAAPQQVPSPSPTARPSPAPSHVPSSAPTRVPSESPTTAPQSSPTRPPSGSPSAGPTAIPTGAPVMSPTGPPAAPSAAPTAAPTGAPLTPTPAPTGPPKEPTSPPTRMPSSLPTRPPSSRPSRTPSSSPSGSPSTALPSSSPSRSPVAPSSDPTVSPTFRPTTGAPTGIPSSRPSSGPSSAPVSSPTKVPTGHPQRPTSQPTGRPSQYPSGGPTASPLQPTGPPTLYPSRAPSLVPSLSPSQVPSPSPLGQPSDAPTFPPSAPSRAPSAPPRGPTVTPAPVTGPSAVPTKGPAGSPTQRPSPPSAAPVRGTSQPTASPTSSPTWSPRSVPSPSAAPQLMHRTRAPTAPSAQPLHVAHTAAPERAPPARRPPTRAPGRHDAAAPPPTPGLPPQPPPWPPPTLHPPSRSASGCAGSCAVTVQCFDPHCSGGPCVALVSADGSNCTRFSGMGACRGGSCAGLGAPPPSGTPTARLAGTGNRTFEAYRLRGDATLTVVLTIAAGTLRYLGNATAVTCGLWGDPQAAVWLNGTRAEVAAACTAERLSDTRLRVSFSPSRGLVPRKTERVALSLRPGMLTSDRQVPVEGSVVLLPEHRSVADVVSAASMPSIVPGSGVLALTVRNCHGPDDAPPKDGEELGTVYNPMQLHIGSKNWGSYNGALAGTTILLGGVLLVCFALSYSIRCAAQGRLARNVSRARVLEVARCGWLVVPLQAFCPPSSMVAATISAYGDSIPFRIYAALVLMVWAFLPFVVRRTVEYGTHCAEYAPIVPEKRCITFPAGGWYLTGLSEWRAKGDPAAFRLSKLFFNSYTERHKHTLSLDLWWGIALALCQAGRPQSAIGCYVQSGAALALLLLRAAQLARRVYITPFDTSMEIAIVLFEIGAKVILIFGSGAAAEAQARFLGETASWLLIVYLLLTTWICVVDEYQYWFEQGGDRHTDRRRRLLRFAAYVFTFWGAVDVAVAAEVQQMQSTRRELALPDSEQGDTCDSVELLPPTAAEPVVPLAPVGRGRRKVVSGLQSVSRQSSSSTPRLSLTTRSTSVNSAFSGPTGPPWHTVSGGTASSGRSSVRRGSLPAQWMPGPLGARVDSITSASPSVRRRVGSLPAAAAGTPRTPTRVPPRRSGLAAGTGRRGSAIRVFEMPDDTAAAASGSASQGRRRRVRGGGRATSPRVPTRLTPPSPADDDDYFDATGRGGGFPSIGDSEAR
eukprot:TRINITY_DN8434_c0_g1_i1.p1 TRINITY_DN8434_c0_g1~~TRINITY_DN8434_c0_g1_i1.p1  ORF type:complete len:1712 (+),score=110.82 TRINITY_DN8434_c0_g1_i1:82-5217(+)